MCVSGPSDPTSSGSFLPRTHTKVKENYWGSQKRSYQATPTTNLVEVALSDEPELVGEDVCVGGDAGDGAGHVLVEEVDLLRVENLILLIIIFLFDI